MNKKVILVGVLIGFSLLNSSCAYFKKPSFIQNRNQEYLNAKEIPPLNIPSKLSRVDFRARYPVPSRYYDQNARSVSLMPPGL